MMKSETGAGQVGLLWVVFLIVLVLGLAGFTYIAFKDKAKLDSDLAAAKASEDATFQKYQDVSVKLGAVSTVLGFRDETLAAAASDPEAVTERITTLKEQFPDHITKDTSTIGKAVDGVVSAHADLNRQLTEAKTSYNEQLELRRQAEESINTIEIENQKRISELEAQLSDEQQRAQTQQDEDSQRISNLQAQLDEAESRSRESESKLTAEVEKWTKTVSMLNARIASQAKKLEVLREPDLPDGTIISTGSASNLAYLDIGKMDGLRRGTKFKVFRYGKGGELFHKGMIEVRDVEKDTAECGVIDVLDKFDPIVKGDVVVNPHFARNMEKTFVFLGEFPASLNKAFAEQRLTALGAKVGPEVNSDTDFLVLGEPEQGEFAQKLEDMPAYKLASQLGVQIYRLKELAAYIEY